MLVLSDEELTELLPLEKIVDAVSSAMMVNEEKECYVPQRMHIHRGENALLLMPSFVEQYFGTKLVSVVPGNSKKNLPVISGLFLLNDGETGLPLALMGAAKLTALRTGAIGAVGVRLLTERTLDSVGLIGCGVQGISLAQFICTVRPIRKFFCLSRSEAGIENFEKNLSSQFPQVDVIRCKNAEDMLSQTNLIVAATTAHSPILPDRPELLIGKVFISIGSYKPAMQEFPDAVYELAGEVIIDSEGAREEVGDIINPIAKGLVKQSDVYTLGKLLLKKRIVKQSTVIFKSTGYALFDLFTAQALFEEAKKRKRGRSLEI